MSLKVRGIVRKALIQVPIHKLKVDDRYETCKVRRERKGKHVEQAGDKPTETVS